MNHLYQITIDDYLEIYKRAKENGKQPGDSMEEEFAEYVKEKQIKSIGATELNRDELLNEYASHGKKILDISTDSSGKQKIKIVKKRENK